MTSDDDQPAGLSITALLSAIGGVVLLALHMIVRLFVPFASGVEGGSYFPGMIVGVLGLLSLVPIAAEIVLGHLGFLATRVGRKRGRTLAVVGLTLGYVLAALYLNRLIVVIIVAAQSGQWDLFAPDFFWWS